MIVDSQTAEQIASHLLQIKAIIIDTQNLFTWASGIKSPIYCDNRKTLSYPIIRNYIAEELAYIIQSEFPEAESVAGVATGGIPHGTLVADRTNLPFIYVRSSSKEHGLGNQIEGQIIPNQKVVVVEDLISTGQSSLKVVEVLRKQSIDVLGMISIFNYNFPETSLVFRKNNCLLYSLCNYDILIKQALKEQYISKEDVHFLNEWKKNRLISSERGS